MRGGGATRSLTMRLLVGVALPMVVLAAALGLGGTLMIRATVGSVNDRILAAAARGIADSLTIENDAVALDLSPAIFGMLENTARDNVYYVVRQGGRPLTGYADLPRVTPAREAIFANARYLDRDVRIVAQIRRLPGLAEPLVVEVAETLDAREADARRLLAALIVLEVALIVVAVLLLPLAVRWGLRPLAMVRGEMDRRAASDLAPLPLGAVPREVRDLVRAFNAMLGRLGGTMAAMRRFTGDASHQMRTPLSILRTHVAVLREAPPGSAEAAQSIADIETGAVRLGHLLVQLLALARADNAASEAVPLEAVDLQALVATVVAEQADAAHASGVDLVVDASGDPQVLTAAALAGELLANLIDNGVRHGGSGGTVRIGVAEDGSVTVDDAGPGIPLADRERVFARFARLTPYGAQGGTGLGLSIARALAQAVSVDLRLEDAPGGRGLRAIVRFPPASLKAP